MKVQNAKTSFFELFAAHYDVAHYTRHGNVHRYKQYFIPTCRTCGIACDSQQCVLGSSGPLPEVL